MLTIRDRFLLVYCFTVNTPSKLEPCFLRVEGSKLIVVSGQHWPPSFALSVGDLTSELGLSFDWPTEGLRILSLEFLRAQWHPQSKDKLTFDEASIQLFLLRVSSAARAEGSG